MTWTDERPLDGETALVTGASSGIGEATAAALADAGATVVVSARREDRLHALAERIEGAGGDAHVVTADLQADDEVRDLVAAAVDAGDTGLDVLVNNAGVMLLERLREAEGEHLRTMVEVNLIALMEATRAALPHLADGGGHVVQVSSVAGRRAGETASGYNATKFGVNGFTEALRQEETANGVRTTLIEPGIVDTELQDHIPDDEVREGVEGWMVDNRPLTSDDVADAIRYAVTRPAHVSVNELLLRPTDQSS